MKLIGGVVRDKGVRIKNEDSAVLHIVKLRKKRAALIIAADGIGSLSCGDAAGGYVCGRLLEQFYGVAIKMINLNKGFSKVKKGILDALYFINEELREYGSKNNIALGTTLSYLLIIGRKYIIINIGDSMIYEIRGKKKAKLKALTIPDINPDGSINKCVGSFKYEKPYVKTGRVHGNTGFLVCTDGFYRKMNARDGFFSPSNMKDTEGIQRRLREMCAHVRKRGESDNLTAIYVRAM